MEAEKHYRQAIIREDTYVPARMNLATLLSRRGATKKLRKSCVKQSNFSLHGDKFIILSVYYWRKIVSVYPKRSDPWRERPPTGRTTREFFIILPLLTGRAKKSTMLLMHFYKPFVSSPPIRNFCKTSFNFSPNEVDGARPCPMPEIWFVSFPIIPKRAFLAQIERNARGQ